MHLKNRTMLWLSIILFFILDILFYSYQDMSVLSFKTNCTWFQLSPFSLLTLFWIHKETFSPFVIEEWTFLIFPQRDPSVQRIIDKLWYSFFEFLFFIFIFILILFIVLVLFLMFLCSAGSSEPMDFPKAWNKQWLRYPPLYFSLICLFDYTNLFKLQGFSLRQRAGKAEDIT